MPPKLQGSLTRSQRTVETRWKRISEHENEVITKAECAQMGIYVIPLELETHFESGGRSIPVAGSFFQPLTDEFMTEHPVDSARLEKRLRQDPELLYMRDYDADAARAEAEKEAISPSFGRKQWGPGECVEEIVHAFEEHISRVPRANIPPELGWTLTDITGWSYVNYKVALGNTHCLPRPNFESTLHPVKLIFEAENYIYPHVTMVVANRGNDIVDENSILRHEMAYILKAMKVRLEEGLFDKKQPQPVLMLSFVAPQHGRILEAYIKEQTRVVVACSRLYSFEKNDTAPFELFYRWFLGQPIGVEPSEPRPQPDLW